MAGILASKQKKFQGVDELNQQRFFYLKQQNRIYGPFPAAKILAMYRSKTLSAADQISPDKINWKNVNDFFNPPRPKVQKIQQIQPTAAVNTVPQNTYVTAVPAVPSEKKIEYIKVTPVPQAHPVQQKASSGMLIMIFVLFFLLVTAGGIFFHFAGQKDSGNSSGKTSDSWTSVIEKNKHAVALVVLNVTLKNGTIHKIPMGTAWAFADNTFATNAHVIQGVHKNGIELLKQHSDIISDMEISLILNETKTSYPVKSFRVHPEYDTAKDADFALLYTDKVTHKLQIANDRELHNIKQGTPIAFLGFPMEGLSNGNVNTANPMASLQTGNIVAISNAEYGDSGFAGNTTIRHNLPTVGGASGSPIFNRNGKVIAILFAGHMKIEFDKSGRMVRTPMAAMINFGIRIDRMKQCFNAKEISTANLWTR